MCRVDFWEDGWHVDDVAISGELISMFRLEEMSEGSYWGCVYLRDGRVLHMALTAEKERIDVTAEWDFPAPADGVLERQDGLVRDEQPPPNRVEGDTPAQHADGKGCET